MNIRRWRNRAVISCCLLALTACSGGMEPGSEATAAANPSVKVTGELQSANSYFFGPPAIPDIWNYTIAYMAPDGVEVGTGEKL